MYECVIYNCGKIYNTDDEVKKYIPNQNEIHRFYCNIDNMYENKKPSKTIFYLRTFDNPNPIVNVYFRTINLAKKYVKNNKEFLLENYGKLGCNYYLESLIFSHLDPRVQ